MPLSAALRAPAAVTSAARDDLVGLDGAAHARCRFCGSERTMVIALTLTDGTPADFISCRVCERRSWASGGQPLGMTDVLRRTTKVAGRNAVPAEVAAAVIDSVSARRAR